MEPATEVMTLGRVGMLAPQWRTQYLNPPASTRQVPQNRLRQTINGPRSGSLSRQLRVVPRRRLSGPFEPAITHTQARYPGMPASVFASAINRNAFGTSLLGGLARAKRIALGQIEVDAGAGALSSEEIDASLDMTGEALDASFTPEQIQQIEDTRIMDAEAAAGRTDEINIGPAIRIGKSTAIGWGLVSTASAASGIYHGYRRNNSLGWGLWWGLMGAVFPVVSVAVSVAQGYGKRKGR